MFSPLFDCESMNFQLGNELKSLIRELKDEHFFLVDDNIEWVLLALIVVHILINNCLFSSIIMFFLYLAFVGEETVLRTC